LNAFNETQEVLARLDRLTDWERKPRNAIRAGLEPMLDLMERLGNPHRRLRAIHVTGTKGKGSVCALIEAALLRAGLRVGRYASPHVEDITERVSLMGQSVGQAELASALTEALDAHEAAKQAGTHGASANWFDLLTAASFLIFAKADLDWVVLEVGIGGRLDSTNVVDAEVAVITNVELEHTEVLGRSREAIAREKAGILKAGACLVTTLSSDDPAGLVIWNAAATLGCTILHADLSPAAAIESKNAEMAGLALDYLGRREGLCTTSQTEREAGVGAWLLDEATRARARLPGRLEQFDIGVLSAGTLRTVPIVLDGAHVPFNLEAVLRDLASRPGLSGTCVAVATLAPDKDAAGFFGVLSRHAACVILTMLPDEGRRRSLPDLVALATSADLKCEVDPDAHSALDKAIQAAAEANGWVLVTGSLYLVGAVRKAVISRSRSP
jgi:dihydrofolate synthase / folylpolyglutamate synthase